MSLSKNTFHIPVRQGHPSFSKYFISHSILWYVWNWQLPTKPIYTLRRVKFASPMRRNNVTRNIILGYNIGNNPLLLVAGHYKNLPVLPFFLYSNTRLNMVEFTMILERPPSYKWEGPFTLPAPHPALAV